MRGGWPGSVWSGRGLSVQKVPETGGLTGAEGYAGGENGSSLLPRTRPEGCEEVQSFGCRGQEPSIAFEGQGGPSSDGLLREMVDPCGRRFAAESG